MEKKNIFLQRDFKFLIYRRRFLDFYFKFWGPVCEVGKEKVRGPREDNVILKKFLLFYFFGRRELKVFGMRK